ncbi:MAG: hypothetical protein PHE02_12080 [Lachnospiraceae bacterium]|nr:hypothetical protein [Lachnospiraceae bacterium]
MGIMDNAAVQNLTGNVARAIIEILDEREALEKLEEKDNGRKKSSISSFGLKKSAILSAAENKLAGALTSADVIAQSSLGVVKPTGYKQFSVQFNPANLQISAQGGGNAQITDATKGKNAISVGKMNTRILLTVPLIFDKVSIRDAFMTDKFALDPKSMAIGIGMGIANEITKTEYTVQPVVEGFIAALRAPRTRKVTFAWSKLKYSGVLNSISSQYTMFSVTGKPVRAVVNIGILCADQSTSIGYMGQWQQHYEDAFVNQGSSDYVSGAQNASNLLNLPF